MGSSPKVIMSSVREDRVQDRVRLSRERARIARELHPDRGGDVDAYRDAMAALDGTPAFPHIPRAASAPVQVRRTMSGRLRRGGRKAGTVLRSLSQGAASGVTFGRRLIRRPAPPPRVI